MLCALGSVVLGTDTKDDDFTSVSLHYDLDVDLLKAEKSVFTNHTGGNANTVAGVLDQIKASNLSMILPVFVSAVKILGTIPATPCSAERSFSGLRRMKSYLRSTMGEARLRSLAVLNIEREYSQACVSSQIDQVIDVFGSRTGRCSYFF